MERQARLIVEERGKRYELTEDRLDEAIAIADSADSREEAFDRVLMWLAEQHDA